MRILGIDYGDARVGIAITDKLNITAQGLETIQRNGSDKTVLKRLDEIFKIYDDVDTIVIGLPLNMNGTMSKRAETTLEFIHKLNSRFNTIPVVQVDERLTTVEAHRTMNDLNIKNRKKKDVVDTIAAVYILEQYMNTKG